MADVVLRAASERIFDRPALRYLRAGQAHVPSTELRNED
jgi:hypothetical protein